MIYSLLLKCELNIVSPILMRGFSKLVKTQRRIYLKLYLKHLPINPFHLAAKMQLCFQMIDLLLY